MEKILDALLANPDLRIVKTSPILFTSDWHVGGGGKADNFVANEPLAIQLMDDCILHEILMIEVGDGDEGWQFSNKEIAKAHPAFLAKRKGMEDKGQMIRLGGNHNKDQGLPESLVIEDGHGPVLVTHGHKGIDLLNDKLWFVGRFFTRYVWKPLEIIGVNDWTSASNSKTRHDLVRYTHNKWANDRGVRLVYGHLHSQFQRGYAVNIGCGITPGEITCVELQDGQFQLIRWTRVGRQIA